MTKLKIALLIALLTLGARAQFDQLGLINQAAAAFNAQLGQGLKVTYVGEGRFAGNIFQMTLENPTGEPMSVNIPPGLVLLPGDSMNQRMVVESAGSQPIVVAPGQTVQVTIRGYCLDSSKLPPGDGEVEQYTVATDVTPHRDAVLTVLAGLRLSGEDLYGREFKPTLQRTIVVQRSIWAQDADPYTQNDLYTELTKELLNAQSAQVGHSGGDPEQLTQAIWRDVELTLRHLED